MELKLDDDLRARIERLEVELDARTAVIEQLLAVTALQAYENKRPGSIQIDRDNIEKWLANPREGEAEAQNIAMRAAYRRVFSQVTTPPPWKADTPQQFVQNILLYGLNKMADLWKRRRG